MAGRLEIDVSLCTLRGPGRFAAEFGFEIKVVEKRGLKLDGNETKWK